MLMIWENSHNPIFTTLPLEYLFESPQRTKSVCCSETEKQTSPKNMRGKMEEKFQGNVWSALHDCNHPIFSSHVLFREIQKPSSTKHYRTKQKKLLFKKAISFNIKNCIKMPCVHLVNPPWDVNRNSSKTPTTPPISAVSMAPMPKVIVRIQYLRKSSESPHEAKQHNAGRSPGGQVYVVFYFFWHLEVWRIGIEFMCTY